MEPDIYPPELNQMPPMPPQTAPAENRSPRQQSISLKIVFIILISLLLLIPDAIIYSLNDERETSQTKTTQEISQSWSGRQLISGPIISIPYCINGSKAPDSTGVVRLLPEKLIATGDIKSQTLSRSIYETAVYNTDITLSGNFNLTTLESTGIPASSLQMDKAYVTIGIGDLKGVESITPLQLGDSNIDLNGSVNMSVYTNRSYDNNTDYVVVEAAECYVADYEASYDNADTKSSGCMQANITLSNLNDTTAAATHIPYSITMQLKGSQSLGITPVGRESQIDLKGLCKSPSFAGMFIPTERTVDNGEFTAMWKLNSNNREYPQAFVGDKSTNIAESAVVVNMLIPVDRYLKVARALKYAIIVIMLTFIAVLFCEIMTKTMIHIFQYLLIGLALILFYSLLLSLAEHISFGFSYFIAAAMTIGMVSLYMHGILKRQRIATAIGALLTVIYIFIYILLCLETFALLTGSIGLFIALAAIMYASLKIKGDTLALK